MAKHDESAAKNGALGGRARAQSQTPEQRRITAQKAADARWGRDIPTALHVGPLELGGMTLECAVLPDKTRVITQGSIMTALGRSNSSGRRTRNDNRPPFAEAGNLTPYFTNSLTDKFRRIEYRLPDVPGIRQGYDAEILPQLCEIYLDARRDGVLIHNQMAAAEAAELLIRGLARVGIIALVDEATGYQDQRSKDALARILETFVAEELQPWVKTFPIDFYRELFRLRGVDFDPSSVKRPPYFGHLTNNIVYKRLAPGVWHELKAQQKEDSGRGKLHQRLSPDAGHPKLREHLSSVTTIMKLSDSWDDFLPKLNRVHPMIGEDLQPALFDDPRGL